MEKLFPKSKKNSFTLIESLLAVFIISVAFVSVTRIFPLSLRVERSSEMRSKAVELAQAKIEELSLLSYEEVSCSGNIPPCEETENPVAEDKSFRRNISVTYVSPPNFGASASDTNMKKVSVTLFWDASFGAGENNIVLSTIIANK